MYTIADNNNIPIWELKENLTLEDYYGYIDYYEEKSRRSKDTSSKATSNPNMNVIKRQGAVPKKRGK